LLTTKQGGTTNTDNLFSGAAGESDTVVLTGRTDGNWEGTNAGDFDFLVVKLGADGDEIWRWQVRRCSVSTYSCGLA
ncbi:unnamed protein product, partial [Sphacelaria rigidula]